MNGISILGSTGSIGRNTLKVIEHLGNSKVVAMAAGRNTKLFAEQIAAFSPQLVSCIDDTHAEQLERDLACLKVAGPKIVTGEAGLIEVATHDGALTVVSATVGAVGFVPTLRAIETGKRVALANKETLVMAGELMTRAAKDSGAEILPVDSEHNAIHQCLRGEKLTEVRRLILTASGGPFLSRSKAEIEHATREEALNHPNWSMGEKITIDSATLMNKGLEVIEAHWLFGLDVDRISVIVHPQSVIHSMVEMVDGSIIAQMGVTDMKHAIQYALTYPDRRENCLPALDLSGLSKLEFHEPDLDRFACLRLAYEALRAGGTMPAVLNAANEITVRAFLDGEVSFGEIARVNERVMAEHEARPAHDIETILDVDSWAREAASTHISHSYTAAAITK